MLHFPTASVNRVRFSTVLFSPESTLTGKGKFNTTGIYLNVFGNICMIVAINDQIII